MLTFVLIMVIGRIALSVAILIRALLRCQLHPNSMGETVENGATRR